MWPCSPLLLACLALPFAAQHNDNSNTSQQQRKLSADVQSNLNSDGRALATCCQQMCRATLNHKMHDGTNQLRTHCLLASSTLQYLQGMSRMQQILGTRMQQQRSPSCSRPRP